VGNHQDVIVLNGNKYNASTGKIVDTSNKNNVPIPKVIQHSNGLNMDGFTRPSKKTTIANPSASTIHTSNERSQTLMRSAVKKPNVVKINPTPPFAHTTKPITNTPSTVLKQQVHIDTNVLSRAEHTPKSSFISKFGFGNVSPFSPKTSYIPVTPSPSHTSKDQKYLAKTDSKGSSFQDAIDNAKAHEQPTIKKPHIIKRTANKLHISTRVFSVSAAALGLIIIAGYFAYINVPNVAVRIASARAGVHATMPSYKPAGFAINGPIQYKPGQISISFRANTNDNRAYTITQSSSSWNSETLLDNYVAANNQPYQTYENNGKTIYIYNGGNATWVDGGIWYKIDGNSSLNSDQLLRIANSI